MRTPGQVLRDGHPQEFEAADPLHHLQTDGERSVILWSAPAKVNNDFLGLLCVQEQVVVAAP